MAKRVMRAFKLHEISAVDRPAQAHARAAIMKRDVRKDMYQVSRFADVLCSIGYLMQSSQYEADSEGDSSVVPAQLRSWLKSGAEIFHSMAAEELSELLATINKADEPYWKREFSESERKELAASGAAESDGSYPISNAKDLHNAMRAYGRSKNKAKTKAHIRARAKSLGLESELSDAFKRAEEQDALTAGGAVSMTKGESDMDLAILRKALGLPDSATEADITKKLAEQAAALASVAKMKVDLAIAKANFSPEELAHYHKADGEDDGEDGKDGDGRDGLDGDGRDGKRRAKKAFRLASKADRAAIMKAAEPAVPDYVTKALVENEAMKKRLATLEDADEVAKLAKRAAEIGLPEADAVHLQKAYRGDKAAVDHLLGVIKAAHAQVKAAGLFKEIGGSGPSGGVKAYDELVAKATELRKRETSLTQEQAFAKVYADPENSDLVKRERAERNA